MTVDPYDLPAPTSDRNVAERRYKKVVGIVHHNAPIDKTHIQLKFARSYDGRKLGPLLNQAVRNGHLRRLENGDFATTDEVR
ncbi:hypothetical protein OSG_eHP3_00060 [environmental Halophage eHP-3]|nr:hypothetical protein OSG_eHP3_00060 [environmental Halophage eHP-3]